MPRNLDPALAAILSSEAVVPFFAVSVTFVSQTFYLWSGPWPLSWNGQTWTGTGDVGQIGAVAESSEVKATGTTITLSGVDQAILQECLDDVWLGAPCTIYFGALNSATMQPAGTPYSMYVGMVDQPTVNYGIGDNACSISLAIESNMLRLSTGAQRHYTSADQRLRFPKDTFFFAVESLNDQALDWGSN